MSAIPLHRRQQFAMIWMLLKLEIEFFPTSGGAACTADLLIAEFFGASRFTRAARVGDVDFSTLLPAPRFLGELESYRRRFIVAYNYLLTQEMLEEYLKWLKWISDSDSSRIPL